MCLVYEEGNFVSPHFNLTPLVFYERKWTAGESIHTFIKHGSFYAFNVTQWDVLCIFYQKR